ncbi:MAG: RNA polymerase sigma factor [Solobacterium sp.]|nr:RNA polymerase sigma factor [Solobacterium sp.]MBR2793396.1 RNA polymerase sigma factor [Solobacterium sp.]
MAYNRCMALSVRELHVRRILNTYGDSLYRLAFSYLHNDADAQEIVQDTILQLLRYDPDFHGDGMKEKGWLMKTAANLSRNRLRSLNARDETELDETFAGSEEKDLKFVWDAVNQLPEKYREVIHLFYQEGYSTKEIADILGRKEGSVRSDLSRGRDALRTVLKEVYDFE